MAKVKVEVSKEEKSELSFLGLVALIAITAFLCGIQTAHFHPEIGWTFVR